MDKKFSLDINNKSFIKYLKLMLCIALAIMAILLCLQFSNAYVVKGKAFKLATVIVTAFLLCAVFASDCFLITKLKVKFALYGAELTFLAVLGTLTGNAYITFLYCIILSQSYIALNNLKLSTILYCVSTALFLASYVVGWVILNAGTSAYDSFVRIFSESVYSFIFMFLDYAVVNFILSFYNKNVQLKNALAEADASKAELEQAYQKLSKQAVFKERNRIAKDIHDNTGHSITTVIMQTEAAKLLMDTDLEEAKRRIVSANLQAKNALEQMRESVHLLAGRGAGITLKDELENIIAQTIDGTSLKVRYDIDEIEVSEEMFRYICNTVKECLANGIRHGKATAFYVELKKNDNRISLLVDDNGRGTANLVEGFGLSNVKSGAENFCGKCNITSREGEGFQVEIFLPV